MKDKRGIQRVLATVFFFFKLLIFKFSFTVLLNDTGNRTRSRSFFESYTFSLKTVLEHSAPLLS